MLQFLFYYLYVVQLPIEPENEYESEDSESTFTSEYAFYLKIYSRTLVCVLLLNFVNNMNFHISLRHIIPLQRMTDEKDTELWSITK